ncbi:MAG: HD domain-containing protein [Leptolyngbya sp. DLM2.Bin15]|nr:MAG: HD domain-containing protein [Leptolyngbya sp. DLM2.Bin15]
MMHSFAQTNLQLLHQLQQEPYTAGDRQLVAHGYDLAVSLFAGRFRPAGKTFIAHLVGTASILLTIGASVEVSVAGLLHAAYSEGDFWDGQWRPITTKRQQRVRHAVGDSVEHYIARYTQLDWGREAIATLSTQVDTLSALDRDVLLIRLANELEEYLDYGILYDGAHLRQDYAAAAPYIAPLATALGYPRLAQECDRIMQLVGKSGHILAEAHTEAVLMVEGQGEPAKLPWQTAKQLSYALRYLITRAFAVY